LERLLRILHPFMPFITEEIWQRVAPLCRALGMDESQSIMMQAFPLQDASLIDQQTLGDIEWMKSFVLGIRNIRGEMDIPPSKPLAVLLRNASRSDWQRLQTTQAFLGSIARLESVNLLESDEEAPPSATALVGEMEILIPMAGLIDKQAELSRIARALEKLQKDHERTQGKLSNEKFVSNAPAEVIAKEQAKLADFVMQIRKLQEQQSSIAAL